MSQTMSTIGVASVTAAHIDRGLGLTVGFTEAMVSDPELLGEIPHGCTLVLAPAEDPEMFEVALATAIRAARDGGNVDIRHVTKEGWPR